MNAPKAIQPLSGDFSNQSKSRDKTSTITAAIKLVRISFYRIKYVLLCGICRNKINELFY